MKRHHSITTGLLISAAIVQLAAPVRAEAKNKASATCRSVCDEYRAGSVGGDGARLDANSPMSMAYVTDPNRCGPMPRQQTPNRDDATTSTGTGTGGGAADADREIAADFRTGNTTWDDCYVAARARWTNVGTYCAAINLNSVGRKVGVTAASLYTAAAATCASACIAENNPFTAWMKGICLGTGAAAAATDIIGMITIAAKGEEEFNAASNVLMSTSSITGAVGTAGAVTATSMGGGVAGKVSSCASAIAFTVAASLKWGNVRTMGNSVRSECRKIESLTSNVTETELTGNPDNPSGSEFVTSEGSQHRNSGSGGGTGGIVENEYAAIAPSVFEGWANGQFASATAGPLNDILQNIKPADAYRALNEAAKADPATLISKLDTESPGDIIGSMPGLPSDVAGAIQSIGKQAVLGDIGISGLTSPVESGLMKSGSKIAAKPSATNASPFGGLFGNRGIASVGGGTGGEISFEQIRRAIAPEANGDIFHEGYTGSIFDLVSVKIGKNRDRVEQLEWDTPLNRALAGLPAKKVQPVKK